MNKICLYIRINKNNFMLDLKVYDVIRKQGSNDVVKELNANVATATFGGRKKTFADLYSSPNECGVLVLQGTCAPVNGKYEKTVYIVFPDAD